MIKNKEALYSKNNFFWRIDKSVYIFSFFLFILFICTPNKKKLECFMVSHIFPDNLGNFWVVGHILIRKKTLKKFFVNKTQPIDLGLRRKHMHQFILGQLPYIWYHRPIIFIILRMWACGGTLCDER